MQLQIIQDSAGAAAGVFIPIKDWEQLKKRFKALEALEEKVPSPNEQLMHELKEVFQELILVEQGKRQARPVKELLDEL